MSTVDTIAAIATSRGRSAIGMIRVSGPGAKKAVEGMLSASVSLDHGRSRFVILRNEQGEPLDEAMVTYFKAPRSYTGEDLVEITAHGNPSILENILGEIVSRGTRPAGPGEFTSRALANQKISLAEAEALDWIINSESAEAAKIGLELKLSGVGLSVSKMQQQLLNLRGTIESQLDFEEEETGPEDLSGLEQELLGVISELRSWVRSFEAYRYFLEAWTVVFVGPPNSGKSSLFNKVLGLEKSIVFDQPGTTRDFIEQPLNLGGKKLLLIDTAGIRKESSDPIERLGIERSIESLKRANLICWVTDQRELPPEELKRAFANKTWLVIQSKADLATESLEGALRVSVETGEGLEDLREKMAPPVAAEGEELRLSSERQAKLAAAAATDLESAVQHLRGGEYLDLTASEVLKASQKLSDLVGIIPTDEVIQNIFSRFCIGK